MSFQLTIKVEHRVKSSIALNNVQGMLLASSPYESMNKFVQ